MGELSNRIGYLYVVSGGDIYSFEIQIGMYNENNLYECPPWFYE